MIMFVLFVFSDSVFSQSIEEKVNLCMTKYSTGFQIAAGRVSMKIMCNDYNKYNMAYDICKSVSEESIKEEIKSYGRELGSLMLKCENEIIEANKYDLNIVESFIKKIEQHGYLKILILNKLEEHNKLFIDAMEVNLKKSKIYNQLN